MILNIVGPIESVSTNIPVSEVVRLETCSLEFFGKKVYNLYIIVKAGKDENFHLFSYKSQSDFKTAHISISSILEKVPGTDNIIRVEPFSQKGMKHDSAIA